MAPPAEPQHTPTKHLYTDPSIPRPPAAGAATGGRGIGWIDGEVVALVKEMHKSSLSTVDGERERSKVRFDAINVVLRATLCMVGGLESLYSMWIVRKLTVVQYFSASRS
jgi:hypothetical protein